MVDLEKMLKRTAISDRGLSVVIPTYNAAASLADVIDGMSRILEQLGRGHEVIIVNDGSTDDTGSVAAKLAAVNRHLRVVSHAAHQGLGAALRTGFRLAKYPLVLQIGAVDQGDAGEIDRLLRAIDHVDVVCGYRNGLAGTRGRLQYWLYRKLLRWVFAVHVRDVDCGIRLYRRSALRRIPIQSAGRFASAEILAKATFMNMLIGEVAISSSRHVHHEIDEPPGSLFREAMHVFRHPQFRTTNSTTDLIEPATQSA